MYIQSPHSTNYEVRSMVNVLSTEIKRGVVMISNARANSLFSNPPKNLSQCVHGLHVSAKVHTSTSIPSYAHIPNSDTLVSSTVNDRVLKRPLVDIVRYYTPQKMQQVQPNDSLSYSQHDRSRECIVPLALLFYITRQSNLSFIIPTFTNDVRVRLEIPPGISSVEEIKRIIINKIEAAPLHSLDDITSRNYFKELSRLLTVHHEDKLYFEVGYTCLFYLLCHGI